MCVLEKGSEIGAHILSGAVIDPRGLAELLPDWAAGRAARHRRDGGPLPRSRRTTAFRIPKWMLPPLMSNHGNYIVSLGNVYSDARIPFFNYSWTAEDRIAYSEGIQTPRGIDWYVAEIPAGGGAESKVIGPYSAPIKIIQELNRSEIGALATDPQTGLAQLWLFNRNGDVRRVTNDTNHYTTLTIAPSAHRMLATRTESEDSLWVVDTANLLGERTQTPAATRLNLPPGGITILSGLLMEISST